MRICLWLNYSVCKGIKYWRVVALCTISISIYIYLFCTLGTANTSTFEEKQEKNKLIYMQHCTHQFTDNVKTSTLKAALITAQFIDDLLELLFKVDLCVNSHLWNLRSPLHSIKSLMEPASILMSTPIFTLLILDTHCLSLVPFQTSIILVANFNF